MVAGSGERLRAVYAGDVPAVFSAKVADYRASRPDYPAALFDALFGAPSVVADLGSGTGLFTRGLLARGHEVHAVEPSAEMRAAAEGEFARQPRFHGVAGSAEATTLPDGSVDAVAAAQAFHWFDIARARTECLRILRPAGQVVLVWNDRVLTDPGHAALDQLFAEFGGEQRRALVAHEASRSDAPAFFNGAPVRELAFDHQQRLGAVGLIALVCSRSYMPAQDSAAGAEVAARVRRVFDTHAGADAGITLRYRTVALLGRPRA
jgi:SAM-dependent methyltransferase